MKKNIVVGNWKMNLKKIDAINLVNNVLSLELLDDVEVVFAPSSIYLSKVNEICSQYSSVNTASQDISFNNNGAYTGEVSAEMVRSLGVKYTIIGHSERRDYFNETNKELKKKVDLAILNDLKVIFCCGESQKQRESGEYFHYIKSQISECLFHLDNKHFSKIVIAYEPIWAIGTGKTASPDQVEEVHRYIRGIIKERYSENLANNCSILYGGSCNPSNSRELFSQKNIDGGLIGGASLNPQSFVDIINSF